MKNVRLTSTNKSCIGTSLRGYIPIKYSTLVSIFGEPNKIGSSDDKVEWEWIFKLNGKIITIYNWKNGSKYLGKDVDPESINEWHVGGCAHDVLDLLEYFLERNGVDVILKPWKG